MSVYKEMSDEELGEYIRLKEAEIASLQYSLSQAENELFHRLHYNNQQEEQE